MPKDTHFRDILHTYLIQRLPYLNVAKAGGASAFCK